MTGKPAWSFQAVNKDVWDYDLEPADADGFPSAWDGPPLVPPSKQGDHYVLDRVTGRPLTAIGWITRSARRRRADRAGEEAPFSLCHTLRKPALSEADMWGMSPIDQMICRIEFKMADYRGSSRRRSRKVHGRISRIQWRQDWGGVSSIPVRGIIVANYNDMPNYVPAGPPHRSRQAGLEAAFWEPDLSLN